METLSKTLAATLKQLAKLAKAYDRPSQTIALPGSGGVTTDEYAHSPHLHSFAQQFQFRLPSKGWFERYNSNNPSHEFHLINTGGNYGASGQFKPGLMAITHNKSTGEGAIHHLEHNKFFPTHSVPPTNTWYPHDFAQRSNAVNYEFKPGGIVQADENARIHHLEALAGLARKHGAKTLTIRPSMWGSDGQPMHSLLSYENLLSFTIKHNIPTPKFRLLHKDYSGNLFGKIDPIDLTSSALDRHGNPVPPLKYYQGRSSNPSDLKYKNYILEQLNTEAKQKFPIPKAP